MVNTEYKYCEPQHGDPVEIWDQDTHEVRFICPRCCTIITHTWSPAIVCVDCFQYFDVTWDVKVTVHIDGGQ